MNNGKYYFRYDLLLVTTLSLMSCAPTHKHRLQIAGFEAQVSAFESAAASVGIPLYIDDLIIVETPGLSSNGQEDDGLCHPGNATNTPEIEVRKEYWDTADDVQRETLLFHEMGHCILLRLAPNGGHISTLNDDRMPVSIMYPIDYWEYPAYQSYYMDHRQAYIVELFSVWPH